MMVRPWRRCSEYETARADVQVRRHRVELGTRDFGYLPGGEDSYGKVAMTRSDSRRGPRVVEQPLPCRGRRTLYWSRHKHQLQLV